MLVAFSSARSTLLKMTSFGLFSSSWLKAGLTDDRGTRASRISTTKSHALSCSFTCREARAMCPGNQEIGGRQRPHALAAIAAWGSQHLEMSERGRRNRMIRGGSLSGLRWDLASLIKGNGRMKMLNIHSYFRLEPRLRFLDSFAKLKKSPDQLGLRQSLLHGLEPLPRAAVAVRLNFLEERREAPRCAQDPEHAHIPQVRLARPAPKKNIAAGSALACLVPGIPGFQGGGPFVEAGRQARALVLDVVLFLDLPVGHRHPERANRLSEKGVERSDPFGLAQILEGLAALGPAPGHVRVHHHGQLGGGPLGPRKRLR
mmetsp:Transcript_16151/g.37475  ORF Transcript_16151/g.37475 Transcript_16151/m.37475 type:complete len:316 (+) Transcript_16151:849-1796(+)